MKATGVVRRIDDLGRVVIPREIREYFHIEEGEPLEIFTDEDCIIFKKISYNPLLKMKLKTLKNIFKTITNVTRILPKNKLMNLITHFQQFKKHLRTNRRKQKLC